MSKEPVELKGTFDAKAGFEALKRPMVWDPDTQEYIANEAAARREAEEGRRQAEGVNRQFIIDSISAARAAGRAEGPDTQSISESPLKEPDLALNELDDRELVEQMEQMRIKGTASSRWKAADILAAAAKGKRPDVKPESKRERLHDKHEKKYPGAW
jgi:hypothetical protein